MNLYYRLKEYKDEGYYPLHMPGHKRNSNLLGFDNPYTLDITEIDGFDNLHHAEGILKDGMERCSKLFGSDQSFYLVGGSSCGILAGIAACTKKNDKVLVARNSHKSVYHALYLNELNPIYLYPDVLKQFHINGSISPKQVEESLKENPDIKLIIITSPTYEGVISDIESIAVIAHKYKVPLLVDEAHGAHLGFHGSLPKSSIYYGADVVVQSIHKTLPSFTQSALLHVNGNLVDNSEIKRYLSIYQTSSPSYILMAGMEQCMDLLEHRRTELFDTYINRIEELYAFSKDLKHLKALTKEIILEEGAFDFDPSKIVISTKGTNLTGKDLYDCLLNRYKIQMEMVSNDYVLGMTSIADTTEGFHRIMNALKEIDNNCTFSNKQEKLSIEKVIKAESVLSCYSAYEQETEKLLLTDSKNRIAAEYIYLYPPGIPLLVPGERIKEALLEQINTFKEAGLSIQGMDDLEGRYIKVIKSI